MPNKKATTGIDTTQRLAEKGKFGNSLNCRQSQDEQDRLQSAQDLISYRSLLWPSTPTKGGSSPGTPVQFCTSSWHKPHRAEKMHVKMHISASTTHTPAANLGNHSKNNLVAFQALQQYRERSGQLCAVWGWQPLLLPRELCALSGDAPVQQEVAKSTSCENTTDASLRFCGCWNY